MPPKKGRKKTKHPIRNVFEGQCVGHGSLEGPEEEATGDAEKRDEAHERHGGVREHRIQSAAFAPDDADTDGPAPRSL